METEWCYLPFCFFVVLLHSRSANGSQKRYRSPLNRKCDHCLRSPHHNFASCVGGPNKNYEL